VSELRSDLAAHRDRIGSFLNYFESESFVKADSRIAGRCADRHGRVLRIGFDQLGQKRGADAVPAMAAFDCECEFRRRIFFAGCARLQTQPDGTKRLFATFRIVRNETAVPGSAPALDIAGKFRLPDNVSRWRRFAFNRLNALVDHLPEKRFIRSGKSADYVIHRS
jgi:hypothetical protein